MFETIWLPTTTTLSRTTIVYYYHCYITTTLATVDFPVQTRSKKGGAKQAGGQATKPKCTLVKFPVGIGI